MPVRVPVARQSGGVRCRHAEQLGILQVEIAADQFLVSYPDALEQLLQHQASDGLGRGQIELRRIGQQPHIDNPLPMLAVITNPGSGTSTDTQTYAPDGTLLTSTHPDEAYTTDYYTHDALGSIVDDLQDDGTLLTQTSYDPYGSPDPASTSTVTAGVVNVGFGYTGAYQESATGDYALRARDYSPATGRFVSTDPRPGTRELPNPGPYLYAGNNPTRHVDPSGKSEGLPGDGGGGEVGAIEIGATEIEALESEVGPNHPELDTSSMSQAELKAQHEADDAASTGGLTEASGTTCAQVGSETQTSTTTDAAEASSALEDGAAKVPSDWGPGKPNRDGGGTRWFDPDDPESNGVRIDEAVPGSRYPSQQVGHVVVRSEGKVLGSDGKPIVGSIKQNPQAHIPLSEWLRWSCWNTP